VRVKARTAERTASCSNQETSEVTANRNDSRALILRRKTMLAAAAAIVHPPQGMAKTYRRHRGTRLINSWFRALTKLGLGAPYRQILTVPGRKTGQLHSTPVDVIELGGQRWLVAGYGPANWVLNTRAHGQVTLSRGRHAETYKVEEVGAEDAIPVLRKYIAEIRCHASLLRRYPELVRRGRRCRTLETRGLPFDPVHAEPPRERMRKDVREFIRRLEAVGLTVEPTPGHYRVLRDGKPLRKANGMPFTLPFSPDTIRWRRAAVVELRKLGIDP
jgi:deazaflavin-dependent oxidoreductase (nitroreductase family)